MRAAGATKGREAAQPVPASTRAPQQEPPLVESVLDLQRRAGNHATARLIALQRVGGTAVDPTLRWGSRGAPVKTLQDHLVQAGAAIEVDGIFGPITRQAVVLFQKHAGLTADGIVGPKSWAALKTGGVQIPPEQAPGKAFSASDLGDKLASRLQVVATHLGQVVGSGTAVGGGSLEPFAPLAAFTELLAPFIGGDAAGDTAIGDPAADAGALAGLDANGGAGGQSQAFGPDGAGGGSGQSAAESALQVLSLMQQMDPGVRSGLGETAAALDAVVPGLATPGGLATQNTLTQLDTIVSDLGEFTANQAGANTGAGSTNVVVKNDTTYKITGTTIADVGQKLDEHMAIHGEAAHVSATGNKGPTPGLVVGDNGRVKSASIVLELDRVLPEWVHATTTKCACWKKEWDRFDTAIRAHEQEHVNIFTRFYTGLHLKVVGKTEAEAIKIIDETTEKADKAQADYDTNTNHGQKPAPGTAFNAGTACTC